MSLIEELHKTIATTYEVGADIASTQTFEFPLMPLGTAYDMGSDAQGVPLFDPRIFDSREFQRNP